MDRQSLKSLVSASFSNINFIVVDSTMTGGFFRYITIFRSKFRVSNESKIRGKFIKTGQF